MQSRERLPLQPWMASPATLAVLDALQSGGSDVRFVGGCVRDAIKGLAIKDIDIATPDRPERVMSLLKSAGIKAIPTGIEHGTITAVTQGEVYEVTTLREDVETDGRRAKVAYTDDWVQDAARRDLTINALSCRPDGSLSDPFGGLEDLRNGRVRFVGNAHERITEDYLRLLRFFRFHAYYGQSELDAEGVAAAKDLAANLSSLSGERVREELLRLMAAQNPIPVLDTMIETGVISVLMPEAQADTHVLDALMEIETAPDALLRLSAFLMGGREEALHVAERLRFSRTQADKLVSLRTAGREHSNCLPGVDSSEKEIRQALYDLGMELTGDLLHLNWALENAEKDPRDKSLLSTALAVIEQWEQPAFPLRGRDALALGAESGPALGDLLEKVEAWWRAADFQPDRDACLDELKGLVLRSRA